MFLDVVFARKSVKGGQEQSVDEFEFECKCECNRVKGKAQTSDSYSGSMVQKGRGGAFAYARKGGIGFSKAHCVHMHMYKK